MSENVRLSRYRGQLSTLIAALGATDVQSIEWNEGGPEGVWVVEHTPTEAAATPIPQMTREDRHFTRYPFIDFKNHVFPDVPLSAFAYLSVEMNSTYVWFDLNQAG